VQSSQWFCSGLQRCRSPEVYLGLEKVPVTPLLLKKEKLSVGLTPLSEWNSQSLRPVFAIACVTHSITPWSSWLFS